MGVRERLVRVWSGLGAVHASARAYPFIVVATLVSCVLGLVHPYAMPVLNALALYPLYFVGIRRKNLATTLRQVFVWAVTLSATIIVFTVLWPELMRDSILFGEEYKHRMLQAIRSSTGSEGTPQGFIAKYVREGAIFLGLAAISAGAFALVMGAYLLNYMNYYVGYLFTVAENAELILFIGWPPWSIVRVVGFNMAALGVSCLALHRLFLKSFPWPDAKKHLLLGLAFIVLNVLIRLAIEPYWKLWLQPQL